MTFISYAQNYEDVVLWRALKGVKGGFYIDIGAGDPKDLSVTCAFYDRGWSGINVEPASAQFGKLTVQRPRDVNLNAVVGNTPGIVKLHEFADAGLSTISATVAQRHINAGSQCHVTAIPMLSLASICQYRGTLPIHFLKIDVEGAEREVLLSMDFSLYRPWVVVVEATEPLTQISTKALWEDSLLDHSYIYAYNDGLNCFYVAEEQKDLIERLAVPPSIFDDFIKSDEYEFRKETEQWRLRVIAEQQYQSGLIRLNSEHIAAKDHQIEQYHTHTMELEKHINDLQVLLGAMRSSLSWRTTAPLRGIASRHPKTVGYLKALAVRYPSAQRNIFWLARNVWRAATLRPFVARESLCAPDIACAPNTVGSTLLLQRHTLGATLVSWFYIGDTLEWLATHQQLTGVGKVSTEILAAALTGSAEPNWRLCLAQGEDLVLYRRASTINLLNSPATADFIAITRHAQLANENPQPGDHVLFAGAVWTWTYVSLLKRLRAHGVRFSVLLHDLIPIEHRDLVDFEHAQSFARWLQLVIAESELVFTSSESVRSVLYQWAIAEGLAPRNPVRVIRFGNSVQRFSQPEAVPLVTGRFVLCVGTIDRRKNQLFLCRCWAKLAAERKLPTLVLVGRDDLRLAHVDAGVGAMVASGAIRILTNLDDAALDPLYRAAIFTVFPSLSEGYGLPVADSLSYGKLCLAADLAVIREWAADLPWYFDPRDSESLLTQLRRALDDASGLAAAEARIAAWRPHSWRTTVQEINKAISARLGLPDAGRVSRVNAPVPVAASAAEILDRARRWCTVEHPEVSIIIVSRNTTDMTRACVRHVWANTTEVPYEIIVVDNGSEPSELDVLRGPSGGLRLLALGTNRYFGEANNIAVEAARGRFVCFLNNDVFVSCGWLSSLVAALAAAPEAGAVGPVFTSPDGTIQEAGGILEESGIPERLLRGAPATARAGIADRRVDYISAACLLLPRALFLQVGGFDLTYEPDHYEDVDLCFKLAALGYSVNLVASANVTHIEGFSTVDPVIPARSQQALSDLNRSKFISRWGDYLQLRDQTSLIQMRALLPEAETPVQAPLPKRRALIFSPYTLTPGGGERYVLTIASALTKDYAVTISAPHAYSHLRLRQLGKAFGIDLSPCSITSIADLTGQWDVMVALGNHIVPPVRSLARRSFFICQFPFPLPHGTLPDKHLFAGYEVILAYSDFVRRNIETALTRQALPSRPVKVLYPPVPQVPACFTPKKSMVLTVGRFFSGGHSKRHDVLIGAFRDLSAKTGEAVEFHIAGSSMPDQVHMDYLAKLQEMAVGQQVIFHVNATPQTLVRLYHEAAFYWHGTGLNSDLERSPELAEHFGIAIVEAMSAGCVSFALNAGAAPEIITDCVDGCLYDTTEALVERTFALLREPAQREAIGVRARRRAADFAVARFTEAVRDLLT
jgi:FkbM family methyltransferase